MYRARSSKHSPAEDLLIQTLGRLVTESVRGFRSREELEILFSSSDHLGATLTLKKNNRDLDDEVFAELKKFITKYSPNDFSGRPILKNLYKYLMEVYRKLNLKNSMASTFQRISSLKTQISDLELAADFTERGRLEMEQALKVLKDKFALTKAKITNLETVISDTEISNVRSAQIINSTTENVAAARAKLTNTQERIKNILGDCVMMACSVVYLGIFQLKNRIEFRKSLRETLETFNINCSSEWQSDDPEVH